MGRIPLGFPTQLPKIRGQHPKFAGAFTLDVSRYAVAWALTAGDGEAEIVDIEGKKALKGTKEGKVTVTATVTMPSGKVLTQGLEYTVALLEPESIELQPFEY